MIVHPATFWYVIDMEKEADKKAAILPSTKIAVFKGRGVRKTIHHNEWWFVIDDVVSVLTDSIDPKGYIRDMRRRDEELGKG